MSFELRGGVPRPQLVAGISATGAKYYLGPSQTQRGTTKWLRIKNTGANILKMYFTQEAFDAGTPYISLATNEILREPIEADALWLQSAAATTSAEILPLFRRG